MSKRHLLPLAALALLGAGCTQSIQEKAVESAINAKIQGEGKVNVSDDTVSFTGENGEMMQYGKDLTLPSDFPKDTPIYEGKLVSVVNTADGSSATVQTDAEASVVIDWYKDQLKDWEMEGTTAYAGWQSIQFSKGDMSIMVTVTASANGSTVMVVRSKE